MAEKARFLCSECGKTRNHQNHQNDHFCRNDHTPVQAHLESYFAAIPAQSGHSGHSGGAPGVCTQVGVPRWVYPALPYYPVLHHPGYTSTPPCTTLYSQHVSGCYVTARGRCPGLRGGIGPG